MSAPTDWNSVKAEIIAELRKDKRKDEISSELDEKGRLDEVAKFFRHPAVIVTLTFFLTSLVGTQITSRWQEHQREIDQKYTLADQANKSIVEYLIAAEDIVSMYQGEAEAPNRADIEKERWSYWQQRSREWRIFSDTFAEKLSANFTNDDIRKSFEEIKKGAEDVSWKIGDIKTGVDHSNWKILADQQFVPQLEAPLKISEHMRKQTQSLIFLMEKDAHGDNSLKYFQWLHLRLLTS
jgi:hypothetical protein